MVDDKPARAKSSRERPDSSRRHPGKSGMSGQGEDAGARPSAGALRQAQHGSSLTPGGRVEKSQGTRDGRELLYGRHAVLESLRAGRRRIYRIYVSQGAERGGIVGEIISTARERGCPVSEASRTYLERAAPANHQGVVAESGPYPYVDLDDLIARCSQQGCLYLALDHLQDVQNLATLLRTAEAMAVSGVILPDRRSASVTPAVVNASAGAVEHLSIAQVTNLVQAVTRLKAAGIWVVGLDASQDARPLVEADLSGPLALIVGAEGSGLAHLVRRSCDWLLRIPMYGKVASLNAAVAGSIALVAARHARMPTAGEPGIT